MPSDPQAIERRRRDLQRQLAALSGEPLMRGSIYHRRRRCGRPRCRCATDPKAWHPGTFLSVYLDGRTRGFHLGAEEEARVQQALATYQRLWKVINELTACEVAELRRAVRERRRVRRGRP